MKTLSIALVFSLIACETKEESYEEWHDDYMNARQNDSTEDLCSEYYQDCVEAGYDEEACSIRLEECDQWVDREPSDEDREDREETDTNSECDDAARAAYEECLNDGGSDVECREVYGQTYDDCVNGEE